MRFIAMSFILWTLSSSCALSAYVEQEGVSVVGRVIDQTGAVLPGVTIDLVTSQAAMTTVSDGSGLYRLVPVGSAELTFRLINFTVLRRTVVVAEAQSATRM